MFIYWVNTSRHFAAIKFNKMPYFQNVRLVIFFWFKKMIFFIWNNLLKLKKKQIKSYVFKNNKLNSKPILNPNTIHLNGVRFNFCYFLNLHSLIFFFFKLQDLICYTFIFMTLSIQLACTLTNPNGIPNTLLATCTTIG